MEKANEQIDGGTEVNNVKNSEEEETEAFYEEFSLHGTSPKVLHKVPYPGNGVTSQTNIWEPIPDLAFDPASQISQCNTI